MCKHLLLLLLVFIAHCRKSAATISQQPIRNYQCLWKSGYTKVIARASFFASVIPRVNQSLYNAKAAGMSTDISIQPQPEMDPTTQVAQMMAAVDPNLYSIVWIMITTFNIWSVDLYQNCLFVQKLVDAVKARGKSVGFFSNSNMWTAIFGSTFACKNFSSYPIWYQGKNFDQAFNDFVPFAGWTQPSMKYLYNPKTCDAGDFRYSYLP